MAALNQARNAEARQLGRRLLCANERRDDAIAALHQIFRQRRAGSFRVTAIEGGDDPVMAARSLGGNVHRDVIEYRPDLQP